TSCRDRAAFWVSYHWSDGTDLVALDTAVEIGRPSEGDFRGALAADIRDIQCGSCGAILRAVAIDPAIPLFHERKSRRLAEHRFWQDCPVCASSLRLYVVEYLRPTPDGDLSFQDPLSG